MVPQLGQKHWDNLQATLIIALHDTRTNQVSPDDNLHVETRMIPVKRRNEFLSRQYLLGCHQCYHPCSQITKLKPPPRNEINS